MTVGKGTMETYSIHTKWECATIALRCWERETSSGIYYCGEILINSSFGSWANTWTACGQPFKQFLQKAEFDYVFTKFMANRLHRFDYEASVASVRKMILRKRQEGYVDKDEAREAWDLLYEYEPGSGANERDFGDAMLSIGSDMSYENPLKENFADPCAWDTRTKYDCQAVGFWGQIWPEFLAELKKETSSG